MAKKYYAVREGRKPGIYKDWETCKQQVDGFSGAVFKGFNDEASAIEWLKQKSDTPQNTNNTKTESTESKKKISKDKYDYIIYADGSCLANPSGPGGIGVVIIDQRDKSKKDKREISKGYTSTTNNRMEIMAVIEGLKAATKGSKILVVTDSQYVVRTMNGEFKKKKNHDLWNSLEQKAKTRNVTFEWIKGHAGHAENERCDKLAKSAAKNPNKKDL